DEQHAGRAWATDVSHLVLERVDHQGHEQVEEIVSRPRAEDLGRPPPDIRRTAEHGEHGQDLSGDRFVDPAEDLDQDHLVNRAPAELTVTDGMALGSDIASSVAWARSRFFTPLVPWISLCTFCNCGAQTLSAFFCSLSSAS